MYYFGQHWADLGSREVCMYVCYVCMLWVDRARVNGTTRYSHEASAELAISCGAIHKCSI